MKLLRWVWAVVPVVLMLVSCGGGKVPYIDSFVAAKTSLLPGQSTTLTAEFGGGDGVIEPGSIKVSSGVPVTVTPTSTTTYTLTVSDSGDDESDTVTVTLGYLGTWDFKTHDDHWAVTAINGAGQATASDNTGSLKLVATPGADAGGACTTASAQLSVDNADYVNGVHSSVSYVFSNVTATNTDVVNQALISIVYGSRVASFKVPVGSNYTLRAEWGGPADKLKVWNNDQSVGEFDKSDSGTTAGLSLVLKACPADGASASFSASGLTISAQ